jgi:phage terminase large subunit
MQPVKASGWVNSNLSDEDKQILIKSGVTPVNDVFYHLWGNKFPIVLLFGGYGSGKSVFAETDLIEKSMQPGYFKCYFGRKILEDVRGSVHSKFVSIIKDNHLQDEFIYSEDPKGSMIIRHRATGNLFVPFGGSKPESLKSIDDPTHFFLEEMDQFTQKDFGVILSRLRTEKGNLQLYGAFNTATVFPDHWIRKVLFPEFGKVTEENKEIAKIVEEIGVTKLFCNYTDNYFINHKDYYNKLKLTAAGDTEYLEAIAEGKWGVAKTGREYFPPFKQSLHVRKVKFKDNLSTHLTYDFNVLPYMTQLGVQIETVDNIIEVRVFKEYCLEPPRNTSKSVCQAYIDDYGKFRNAIFFYGDASGKNRIPGKGNDYAFKDVEDTLRPLLNNNSDRVLRRNMSVFKRRDFINEVLCGQHKIRLIIDESCTNLINDFEKLQTDVNGKLKEKKDGVEIIGHTSDALEYLMCVVFENVIS